MAWIIRTVDTLEEVGYYAGDQLIFGGPWGDSTLFEQVEVEDRITEPDLNQRLRGDYFTIAESTGLTTASGTAFTQKIRLSTPDIPNELPDGYYRLGFSFSWNISSYTDTFLARIRLDETNDIWEQVSKSSVSMSTLNPASGYIYITLDQCVYTFDLEFAAGSMSSTTAVSQAKLEFWRLY